MADVVMISSDSDSDLEGGESVARVVFTPTKRPPSPGTSDEEEDFVDPDRYCCSYNYTVLHAYSGLLGGALKY